MTEVMILNTVRVSTDALFPAQPPADDQNPKRKYSHNTLRLPESIRLMTRLALFWSRSRQTAAFYV